MGRGTTFDHSAIKAAFLGMTDAKSDAERLRRVCTQFNCSPGTAERAIKGRGAAETSASPSGPARLGGLRHARVLPIDHPAGVEHRTLFPTMTFPVGKEWVLKSGEHSAKIGRAVTKGAWKGFPIYTLTLEERATCPTSCRHWLSCYGNQTPFARRWYPGQDLEWRLRREIAALELDYPSGFAVRLHNLGDFYSVAYVEMWRELLEAYPAFHAFGYTARSETLDDEIAYALALLVRDYWTRLDPPRFAVRFSNAPVLIRSTATIESPLQKPRDTTICPAQWTPSGKRASSCAACALCWQTTRRIAFVQH